MDRDYTLVKLLGIIQQCPAGERHLNCGVLKITKKLSVRLAYNYLRSLSDKELQELYKAHCDCYTSRNDFVIYHHTNSNNI